MSGTIGITPDVHIAAREELARQVEFRRNAGFAAGTRDTLTATQQAFLSLAQQVALGAIRGATDAKDAYARVTAALAPFVGVPVAALGEPA